MRRTLPILSLSACLLASPAARAEARPSVKPPSEAPRIERREFTLDNGLAVTLLPFGDVPKTSIQLTVRAGTADEKEAEVWLSRLTGRLLQLGTEKLDARAMDSAVAGWGGTLVVDSRSDATWLGATVLSEFAPAMLGLLGDLVQHPRFPADELPRLQADLVRELNLAGSQPSQMANAALAAAMYPGQAYGRYFPTEAALRAYTVEQARAFFAHNFAARRAHLYIAGRFDGAAVERAVRESLGSWTDGGAPPAREVKGVTARTIHFVERTGAVQSTLRLALPLVPPSHEDYIPLSVMNALLGGSFASRITQNLREKRGYTYSPYGMINVRDGHTHWLQMADVTSGKTGASIREILKEIDRLRRTPPPASELQDVVTNLVGRHIMRLGSRDGLLNWQAFVDFYGLPPETDLVAAYRAVTAEDIRRMARKYLDPKSITMVVVGDGKSVLPQLKGIARIAK